jgi:hypothetical protein
MLMKGSYPVKAAFCQCPLMSDSGRSRRDRVECPVMVVSGRSPWQRRMPSDGGERLFLLKKDACLRMPSNQPSASSGIVAA